MNTICHHCYKILARLNEVFDWRPSKFKFEHVQTHIRQVSLKMMRICAKNLNNSIIKWVFNQNVSGMMVQKQRVWCISDREVTVMDQFQSTLILEPKMCSYRGIEKGKGD